MAQPLDRDLAEFDQLQEHLAEFDKLFTAPGAAPPESSLLADAQDAGKAFIGQSGQPFDAHKMLTDAGHAFLKGIPLAGRIVGAGVGGAMGATVGLPNVGAGLGQEIVGQPLDIANEYLGVEPKKGAGERAVEAATNVATTAGMGWSMAKAANLLGNGWEWAQNGIRKMLGGGPQVAANVAAFDAAGVPIKGAIGATTGSKNVQGFQTALRNLPGGAGLMNKEIDASRAGLARSMLDAINPGGSVPLEMETAGNIARRNAASWVSSEKVRVGDLYNQVPGLKAQTVDLQPLFQQAQQLVEQNAQGVGDPATASLLKKITTRIDGKPRPAAVAFGEAQLMRSDLIDYAHTQEAEIAGKAQGTAKTLMTTLDGLMERTGQRLAPQDLSAWRGANAEWAQFRASVDQVKQVASAPTAVQGFKKLFAGAADGAEMLRPIRATMSEGQWNDVVGFHLMNEGIVPAQTAGPMALVPAGGFDPMRVYASLGKVKSAESKDLLLGALGTARRDTFDKSLEVARLMAQDKVMQNPSGTAGQSAFGKIATGAVIGQGVTLAIHSPVLAAMTVGAELSGPYAMAKLFTYEPYQRWLGQGMKIKPTDYMGLAAHIGRLSAIAAQATPEIREALSDYLAGLKLLNALPRGGTQTVPKEGPPTLLDRAKGAAKAMGLAPRSSADRGADSLIGPRG